MKEAKRLIQTLDHSPSYNVSFPTGFQESMHNKRGAFSESLYVYYSAIKEARKLGLKPSYLSVGLGLGYNEMILAATVNDFVCLSFEKDSFLRVQFQRWLSEDLEPYDSILNLVATYFKISRELIKKRLNSKGKLKLRGTLHRGSFFHKKASVVFYDPFSSKNQKDLWEEEFLKSFIDKACLKRCVFSSYAACSSLKKTLLHKGFRWNKRKGFSKKRESCLAVR